MNILMITQVFWPDEVSSAQVLTDLAVELQNRGHQVTVLTSRHAYESTRAHSLSKEKYKGIIIERLAHSALGKASIIARLIDVFTFNCAMLLKLRSIKRNQYHLLIGSTVPPLGGFVGVRKAIQLGIKYFYYVMDLQPELAIAAGVIKKESFLAKLLRSMGSYVLQRSDLIIALDRHMKKYLFTRGASEQNTHVVPVWPVLYDLYDGEPQSNPFRKQHGFEDKIVIMYSGNHAYVHPLETLLAVCGNLAGNDRFLFVFIGGGHRKEEVTAFKNRHRLSNIVQLPYQLRNTIHFSLAAADMQVVVMGDGTVGFTHPNKIYGALYAGRPILYIGPGESHVTDLLNDLPGNISARHGQVELLTRKLLEFAQLSDSEKEAIGKMNREYAGIHYNSQTLKTKISILIEKIPEKNSILDHTV